MKINRITVELKQGLPNYSSRSALVEALADEGESLDIKKTIKDLSDRIKSAWSNPAPVEAKKTKDVLLDDQKEHYGSQKNDYR